MDLLGLSNITMTRRYQHVVDELRVEAARRIGVLFWPDDEAGDAAKAQVRACRMNGSGPA